MGGSFRILWRFVGVTLLISFFLLILNFYFLGLGVFRGREHSDDPQAVVRSGGGGAFAGRGPLCAGSTRRGSSGEERCLGHADRSGRPRGMGPVPARRPAPLLFNRPMWPAFPATISWIIRFFPGSTEKGWSWSAIRRTAWANTCTCSRPMG